jgi:hypothetical protein
MGPLDRYTSTQLLFLCLQADIVDISSGEEQARQEVPTLDAPENPVTAADTLINLQGPILRTPENLATAVNTLVDLQDLQEPIVTSSAVNPSPQELIASSSAINPSLQEPTITSSAINPPQEKVCYISEPFASSFPYTILIFYLLVRA